MRDLESPGKGSSSNSNGRSSFLSSAIVHIPVEGARHAMVDSVFPSQGFVGGDIVVAIKDVPDTADNITVWFGPVLAGVFDTDSENLQNYGRITEITLQAPENATLGTSMTVTAVIDGDRCSSFLAHPIFLSASVYSVPNPLGLDTFLYFTKWASSFFPSPIFLLRLQ